MPVLVTRGNYTYLNRGVSIPNVGLYRQEFAKGGNSGGVEEASCLFQLFNIVSLTLVG